MKITVKLLEQQFLITFIDQRFGELESKIRNIPSTLLSYREFPYSVTDKNTDLSYLVNRVDGGIQMIFKMKQLALFEIDDLIESLKGKIIAHLHFMILFFRFNKQMIWKTIKFIEYSPTDVVIGMQISNMLDCQFYISKMIGHSLLDKDGKFLRISLIKAQLQDGCQGQQFIQAPPYNLQVLMGHLDVQSFCTVFQNTYLPVQLIYQLQIDYSNITMQQINSLYSFTPNEELGVFQFRNQHQTLFVQMTSEIVNNKVKISLREATAYANLMGCHSKLEFTKYFEDFQLLIKSWEFDRISDLQEFLQKFFILSLGYVHFYEFRTLLFQILKRIKYDRYFIKVFLNVYRYMNYFQQIINYSPKRETVLASKKLYLLAELLNDHYHQIFSMGAYDDTTTQLLQILKQYLDKLDEQINRCKNQHLSLENEISNFVNKLQSVQFSQNTDFSFTIKIQSVQGILKEYIFSKYSIIKKVPNDKQKSWTLSEFPKAEELVIVSYF